MLHREPEGKEVGWWVEAETITQCRRAYTSGCFLWIFTNHNSVACVPTGSQSFQSSLCETSHAFGVELELIIGFCSMSENYESWFLVWPWNIEFMRLDLICHFVPTFQNSLRVAMIINPAMFLRRHYVKRSLWRGPYLPISPDFVLSFSWSISFFPCSDPKCRIMGS